MPTSTLSPRAKSIALFASIVVNVLLVSAVATLALSDSSSSNRDRGPEARVERLANKLPEADANRLRKAFAARAGDLPAAQAELTASRSAFRQALRAEPYNPAAVEKSLAALDASRTKVRQIMRAAVIAAAAEMSAEGRARLADRGKRR